MTLLTLRFLASGNILITVGNFIGIHKSTAGKCVWKVLKDQTRLVMTFINKNNKSMIINRKICFDNIYF